jgi:glyoxylase I family protein
MCAIFKLHHWTLSVRDIEKSNQFYSIFGFKIVLRWTSQDNSLTIVHLSRDDEFLLEMFEYAANRELQPDSQAVGNDLEVLGVKHIAFEVADLNSTHEELSALKFAITDIVHGRTGIDYFFIADPDGNWVEVVQDNRNLRL